jgi:hypothetical protein
MPIIGIHSGADSEKLTTLAFSASAPMPASLQMGWRTRQHHSARGRGRLRWAGQWAAAVAFPLVALASSQGRAAEALEPSIERFSQYVLAVWAADPVLSQLPPPQIITNIGASSKVYGGCAAVVADHIKYEVGGTSYCPATNTMFVVVEQLRPFYEAFGPAAVGYAIAHEYGHYIQTKFQMGGSPVTKELQADCLAGAILGQSAASGIRQADIALIAQTAYQIGSDSHGSSDQRAFAVYSGLGQSGELSCKTADMEKLSRNEVRDPRFGSLASLRSGSGAAAPLTYQPRGPHLRSVSGSLGL